MRNRRWFEFLLLGVVIAAGLGFRWATLDATGLWCDEAESSINALTILQQGYPTDHYLGLPIYENTLVRKWPENSEYEFRDVSYSDKGVAIYHGWLPLYAIAGSFALHHIAPDEPSIEVKNTIEEWKRRTVAARLPSVLFGESFLVFAFLAGTALYGRDAGWISLLALTFNPWHGDLSRQARYYSAAVAISTGCCLMVWMMATERRWKDFVLGAFLFVLLFHTHLLSFVVACVMFGLLSPIIIYRNPKDFVKIAAFGSIVAAGTVPWFYLTDFYRQQSRIPRGWSQLSLPGDFLHFPPAQPIMLAIPFLFVLIVLAVRASSRFPAGLTKPLLDSLPPLVFLSAWAACGYLLFLLFMPAASFSRTSTSYWGPEHLIIPVITASLVRTLTAKFRRNSSSAVCLPGDKVQSAGISPKVFTRQEPFPRWAVAAGLLLMVQNAVEATPRYGTIWGDLSQIASGLRAINLKANTRLYASPNDHLVLTFYTGLPFQSIAPVRKSFLDRYPGDVVFVQRSISDPGLDALSPEALQTAALRSGEKLPGPEAQRLSGLLSTLRYRQTVVRNVGGAPGLVEDVPPFAVAALHRYEEETRKRAESTALDIMTRGFGVEEPWDWGEVFFYRFVNPDSRRGARLNYAARLRGATAWVLPESGTVIYLSAGGVIRDGMGVHFTFTGSTTEARKETPDQEIRSLSR
jgi:hypothetical protein